jgi:hypothetical protein
MGSWKETENSKWYAFFMLEISNTNNPKDNISFLYGV